MSTNKAFEYSDINFGAILTKLIESKNITDIMIWHSDIWLTDIEKGHYYYDIENNKKCDIEEFENLEYKIPRQIAIRMEVAYNEGNPIIDGESKLKDEGLLRVNVIHESLCGSNYPAIAIRKTLNDLRINEKDMLDKKYATNMFIELMKVIIASGCNTMICGETGSGKTELLRYLVRYIRDSEAIITMEDTLEVFFKKIYPHKNTLSLKTSSEYGFSKLLRGCLRQNPDWIIVSETRGQEVLELLEAISTGHRMISTIHASSATMIPERMLAMSKANYGESERIYKEIYQSLDIGIYIHYYNDEKGSHRKIAEVAEFYIDDNGNPHSHIIYRFDYQNNNYSYFKIESNRIRMKLERSNIDLSNIKGTFL